MKKCARCVKTIMVDFKHFTVECQTVVCSDLNASNESDRDRFIRQNAFIE